MSADELIAPIAGGVVGGIVVVVLVIAMVLVVLFVIRKHNGEWHFCNNFTCWLSL